MVQHDLNHPSQALHASVYCLPKQPPIPAWPGHRAAPALLSSPSNHGNLPLYGKLCLLLQMLLSSALNCTSRCTIHLTHGALHGTPAESSRHFSLRVILGCHCAIKFLAVRTRNGCQHDVFAYGTLFVAWPQTSKMENAKDACPGAPSMRRFLCHRAVTIPDNVRFKYQYQDSL